MAKKIKKSTSQNPFAQRLRELINANNTTQQKVADSIGVTRQALNNWVNGESLPDALVTARLANIFDVSVDYIVGNSDVRSADPNIKALSKELGISENAIETLRELYKIEDSYGDLTQYIDLFLCNLEKKMFYFMSQQVINIQKREQFRRVSFKHFLESKGVYTSDDEVDRMLYDKSCNIQDDMINYMYTVFFNERNFDRLLGLYKFFDNDLNDTDYEEYEHTSIANMLKKNVDDVVKSCYSFPEYKKPYNDEIVNKWISFYEKIINMKFNSKEYNELILDSFNKKYNDVHDMMEKNDPDLEKSIKLAKEVEKLVLEREKEANNDDLPEEE